MESRGSEKLLDENQDEGIWPTTGQALRTKKLGGGIRSQTGEAFNRIVQSLHNSDSETLHPWPFRIRRGLENTVYMCLVGIEKLAPIFFLIAVLIPHLLLLPFWYFYLFKGLPSQANGKIPLTTFFHQAIFLLISLVLVVPFLILNSHLKKTYPETDLVTFCREYLPQLPPGLRIVCGFAAYFILGVGLVILYSVVCLCYLYIFLVLPDCLGG